MLQYAMTPRVVPLFTILSEITLYIVVSRYQVITRYSVTKMVVFIG